MAGRTEPVTELRAVLVDDEPPARQKLERLLAPIDGVGVVAEAGDGLEAVRVIEDVRPDLVFLDVQMPGLDGFGVLEALDLPVLPRVIFVTAHDQHALRAFEVRALDYLLKPVDPERLSDTVERVLRPTAPPPDPRSALGELPGARRRLDRFLVRLRGRMILVPVGDVAWIGAAGNYVELHVGDEVHLVRGSLQELERRLPARFVRIHRSTVVNLNRVGELHPWSHGDWLVRLDDGTELRLSRRYRDRLEGIFGS
jgi:two-component system LytT family response regulator